MLRLRPIGCVETLIHGVLIFQGEAFAQVIRHFGVYIPGSFGKYFSELEFHAYQLLPVCRLQRILILVSKLDFKYHKTPISSNHLVAAGGYRMNDNVIKKIIIVSILDFLLSHGQLEILQISRASILRIAGEQRQKSAGRNFT